MDNVPNGASSWGSQFLEVDAEPGHVGGFGEGAAPTDGSGVTEGVNGCCREQHCHWHLCGGVSRGLCERRFRVAIGCRVR